MAALILLPLPLMAAIIEAEGVAAIKPVGLEQARQMAFQDAKNKISLQAGVGIEMSTALGAERVPLESSRMRPAATIGKETILREWQTGDYYHVRISVNMESSDDVAPVSKKYKKKITSTPFKIRKSYVTDDIDELANGFSNELLHRLEIENKFLTKKSQYVISANLSGASQDNTAVMRIASMHDSQFVISGEIVDAGISYDGGYFGILQQKKRRFEVDVFVYDGLTGALIASHKVGAFSTGDVAIGRSKPFASAAFFSTNFGQAINRTIDSVAELISKDLESVPFTAKIIKIADGQIYIDAGGTSFVAPGDKLVAYHRQRELSIIGFGPGSEYGVTETPVGTVSIVQVQPLFSIATLLTRVKGVKVEVGDFIRFDFVGKNQN